MGSEILAVFRSEQLIFLVSQPRAGSTMLQRVLAGHPLVHTTAEPWLMLHPVYALRETGHEAEYGARTAYRALQDFLATMEGGQAHYLEALRHMGLHLYGTACEQAHKSHFLDKTPRYFFIIPELAQIFPNARFIILLRNPLAVLASIMQTWVQGDWIRLSRHRENLVLAPRLLTEGLDLLGERAITVRYETLVIQPATELARVCVQLGLEYHPDMLEYGARPAFQGRYGDPAGVGQHARPCADSLERWLELGRSRQGRHLARAYLAALGPELLARLGYDSEELIAHLEAEPLLDHGLVISWDRIFGKPTVANRLSLILAELAQQRQVSQSGRKLARLLAGRL
jgi:hypothetical protein